MATDAPADHVAGPAAETSDLKSLVLQLPERGDVFFSSAARIEAGDAQPFERVPATVTLELSAPDADTSARLAGLRRGGTLAVAYGTTAVIGPVEEARQVFEEGRERWRVVVRPVDPGPGVMEMAFNGISADRIAEMRARRILLDEHPGEGARSTPGQINEAMLESLVAGSQTPLQAKTSPFPELFRSLGAHVPTFLATARLFGVLYLKLTGVVEHVRRLDLTLEGEDALHVDFDGLRRNPYSNVPAVRIQVTGSCPLTRNHAGSGSEAMTS